MPFRARKSDESYELNTLAAMMMGDDGEIRWIKAKKQFLLWKKCIRHVKYFHVHWKWNHFHCIHLINRSFMWLFIQRRTQLSLCAICKQIILLHRGLLMYLTEVMHKDSFSVFFRWNGRERERQKRRNQLQKKLHTTNAILRTETTRKMSNAFAFFKQMNTHTPTYV